MKLPFKLPSFKLPSFGKNSKKAVEDGSDSSSVDDEQDIDSGKPEAPEPTEESGETAPSGTEEAGDDPSALAALEATRVDDSGDDDDDDKDNKKSVIGKLLGDKKRLTILLSAIVGGVLVVAGLVWFLFSGDSESAGDRNDDSGVPRFEMAIAPKDRKVEAGSLNAISANEKGPGTGIVTPASTVMAYASIAPPRVTDGPLPEPQGDDLIEQTKQGALPKIAEDGRTALKVYAKSFDNKDARPKVVIIVTGLGLSEAATDAAISLLPGGVTLAFDPYAQDLQGWADKARRAGHEILVMAPLEPETFPADDPGPQGLMTFNSPTENLLRLEFILSRMRGYVGVLSVMGSKFNKDESRLETFLKNLKDRGLLFVDGSADQKSLAPALAEKMKLPKAFVDLVLDTTPTKEAIDAKLAELEGIVQANAVAIALSDAYPVSIERIAAWAAGLPEKNMVLAPVSVVADKQFLQ